MRLLPAPRQIVSHLRTRPVRSLSLLAGSTIAAVVAMTIVATPADAGVGTVLGADRADRVDGQYIVVLKDNALDRGSVSRVAGTLASSHHGRVGYVYSAALRGFSVSMSASDASRLAADSAVAWVEQDGTVSIDATQSPTPSWGLDRIDQRALPLNNSYTYPNTATNVHAYIIDTGIRFTHVDFGGRATSGFDAIDGGSADDCHGHGTHVSGTVGGSTYGVAKAVQLVGVRVLDCNGSGTNSQVIAGVDWVTSNAIKPAVANMSLGGSANTSIDTAVANSISSGVSYSIAAGNSNGANACNFSPARVSTAITVGSTTQTDARSSFSNIGTCLDIFAPGSSITSDWNTSNTATNTISGTSMATPHTAGAAALVLSANPSFTPAQVRDRLVADSTTGVVTGAGTGSPNRLLFVSNGGPPPPPPTTVFSDNFETATGWTTNASGTDTATTGFWERGDPAATSSGVTLQLGTTTSGTNDLVTGASAGSSAGVNDVDTGATTCTSPSITLPTGTITLTFSWYLAHLNNATSADYFRVSVVVGTSSTVVFSQAGAAANRAGAWATATVNLSSFAGQTIRLRVEAADASTASLIEAGVDDVVISKS
jgi:subtilisin family serine protease